MPPPRPLWSTTGAGLRWAPSRTPTPAMANAVLAKAELKVSCQIRTSRAEGRSRCPLGGTIPTGICEACLGQSVVAPGARIARTRRLWSVNDRIACIRGTRMSREFRPGNLASAEHRDDSTGDFRTLRRSQDRLLQRQMSRQAGRGEAWGISSFANNRLPGNGAGEPAACRAMP